jgi:hypothetical protein
LCAHFKHRNPADELRGSVGGVETSAIRAPGITATRWFRTAAAIFFVFLWGSAFVPSKIGLLASSPLWFLVVRFGVSGAVGLAIAVASGAAWPRGRRAWAMIARHEREPADLGSSRAGVSR